MVDSGRPYLMVSVVDWRLLRLKFVVLDYFAGCRFTVLKPKGLGF